MDSQFRIVFVVFCVVAILIFTVYLHSVNNCIFYELCMCKAEQSRLKQQLGIKQLQLESLINPASIAQQLGDSGRPTRAP